MAAANDRTTESLLYIAEIIDHFDLVAIQEVNHDLRKFELPMQRYLGGRLGLYPDGRQRQS